MKDFSSPIPRAVLNIEEKYRSNLFAWRGQFSPQLIECLLKAYCPPDSTVLDPFAGSGTVLYEAATMSLAAWGFEINPSAWSFMNIQRSFQEGRYSHGMAQTLGLGALAQEFEALKEQLGTADIDPALLEVRRT